MTRSRGSPPLPLDAPSERVANAGRGLRDVAVRRAGEPGRQASRPPRRVVRSLVLEPGRRRVEAGPLRKIVLVADADRLRLSVVVLRLVDHELCAKQIQADAVVATDPPPDAVGIGGRAIGGAGGGCLCGGSVCRGHAGWRVQTGNRTEKNPNLDIGPALTELSC